MAAEIQTLPDGMEALVIPIGNPVEGFQVIALDVLANYSQLLGEPDPAQTVLLIRASMATKDQTDLWQPLYQNLNAALGDLMDAGVDKEALVDAIDAADQALPRKAVRTKLRDAQAKARTRVGKNKKADAKLVAELTPLLAAQKDKLRHHRSEFLKQVAPEGRPSAKIRKAPSPFGEDR